MDGTIQQVSIERNDIDRDKQQVRPTSSCLQLRARCHSSASALPPRMEVVLELPANIVVVVSAAPIIVIGCGMLLFCSRFQEI